MLNGSRALGCSTTLHPLAGEPELAVAPVALQAPVHVYVPKARAFELLTKYGDEFEEAAPPVRVLFYGKHYDALVDLDGHADAARSPGLSSRRRVRDTPQGMRTGQDF